MRARFVALVISLIVSSCLSATTNTRDARLTDPTDYHCTNMSRLAEAMAQARDTGVPATRVASEASSGFNEDDPADHLRIDWVGGIVPVIYAHPNLNPETFRGIVYRACRVNSERASAEVGI